MPENINPATISPDLTLSGGVINPLSKSPIELELPEPPRNYPTGMQSSNLIPTQKPITGSDISADLRNSINYAGERFKNPNFYGKEKVYNADYDGANFARYAAVPRVFEKYGFHPLSDNEKIYNQEASWWEYYKRSAGAAATQFSTAFSDMLPWNAWDGQNSDTESAKEMERAHAIGHDTRGGFGSFMNNMTVDSGYTFGILGEMAVEEIALWGSSLLTGGATSAFATAKTVDNIRKAMSIPTMLNKFRDRVTDSYDALKNINNLKNIYGYAKSGAKWTGKQLTPHLGDFATDLYKTGQKGESLFTMAKASKGFGAFYRDARAYAAITSESKLEGGSTELNLRDKLIDDYYKDNGIQPDGSALDKIYAQAADAGRQAYLWNLPILYISNKIVFDKALKGFKPMAVFREELTSGINGKLVYNEAWKKAGTAAWKTVETGFTAGMKSLTKANTYKPKNLLKGGLNTFTKYSLANVTEGVQEMYQDAVQNTMLEYYQDRFNHPATAGSRSMWGTFAENAGETVTSKQGWGTFASGFFMGAMVQVPQKIAFEYAPKQFWKFTDKEGYSAHMKQREDHTNKVVDALNAATTDGKFWDAITENTVQQVINGQQATVANQRNDKKAFYDIVDEDVFSHLHTLLKSGKLDLLTDQIKDLKQLDKAGLEEAFGPVEASEGDANTVYQKRLDSMLRKADMVKEQYENIEKRFTNIFNPSQYDPKTDPTAYRTELAAYNGFEAAKKAAVYSNYGFERTIERMKSVMDDLNIKMPIGQIAASEFTTILNKDNLKQEIELLESDVSLYKGGDRESVQKAYQAQRKLTRLRKYESALEMYQEALMISSKKDAGLKTSDIDKAEKAGKVREGSVVKNKKGNEHTVAEIKKGWAYNKSGEKIGKTEDLEVISGEEEQSLLDASSERFYKAYYDYLKEVAKDKNTFAKDEDIMKSFQSLKDFWSLNQDARDMSDAIDTLHNPKKFIEYASRIGQVYGELEKQNKQKIENAYKNFLKVLDTTELFKQLYKLGVFLDEEGIDSVIEGRIPSDFYSIAAKEKLDPSDPLYIKAMELFEKFEETNGETFEEKPIPEADPEYNFAVRGRNKINNDKRTYKDHAAYWGFDPDANKTSKVNTRQILDKIIKSPHSTKKEKMLARRLMTLISKESVITFGKLSHPGLFAHQAGEAKAGTFIDARYTSRDYRGGGIPIESLILHELIHEITSLEMVNDKAFKADITKLFQYAKAAYAKNRPIDPALYKDATRKEFYGLKNEDEFLAEMFSNDRFALWLDTIPYETTGNSLWKEFTDSLERFLKRILGVREGSSLLTEAVHIATTHIDRIHGGVEPIKEGTAEAADTKSRKTLTPGSSIEAFREAGVLDDIIKAYKEFVVIQMATSPDGWPDEFAPEKTDDQIITSPYFREYLTMGPAAVDTILNRYNRPAKAQENISEAEQLYGSGWREVEENEVLPIGSVVNMNQATGKSYTNAPKRRATAAIRLLRKQLVDDLGFSWFDVNKMSEEEINEHLADGRTKTQIEEEEKLAKQAEEAEVEIYIEQARETSMQEIEQMIDNADFIEELNAIESEVSIRLEVDPESIDTLRISNRMEARKRQLALDVNFEDITVGQIIMMKNKSKMKVISKTEDTLQVRKFGQPAGEVFPIKASEVKDKILYKYAPFMEDLNLTTPVDPATQQVSNENMKNAQELNTTESILEDHEKAKTMTQQEADEAITNNLICE